VRALDLRRTGVESQRGLIQERLAEEFDTLQLLGHALKHRPDQDLRERTRIDVVTVALQHVQQAMDALEMASRE